MYDGFLHRTPIAGIGHQSEVRVRTCPRNVTGNYRVKDWSKQQSRWPHLSPCSFPKPAGDGTVDMLIGVDNADLYLSMVDIRAENGGPVARRGPLGWTCVGDFNEGASSNKTAVREWKISDIRSLQRRQAEASQ